MQSRRIRLVGELLRENLRPILLSMMGTVVTVLVGFVTPLLLAETVDAIIGTNPLSAPGFVVRIFERMGGRGYFIENLWIVALILFAVNLVNGYFMYLKGCTSAQAGEEVAKTLRERLYNHLQRLSYNYHVKAQTGDLIQRCTSDVDTIRRFLAMQLVEIVNAVLMLGIALVILLGKHQTLTWISLVMVIPLFLFAAIFFRKTTERFRVTDEAEGKMSAVLQESMTAVRVVRAFGRQQHETTKFDEASQNYANRSLRLMRLFAVYWSMSDLMSMTQSAATLLVGVWYASRGEISVGTLIVFISYVGMLLWPIRRLGRILADASKSLVALERVDEILRQPAEADDPEGLCPDMAQDIAFDNVSFAYERGRPVLDHVSFKVKKGQTIAILGATGSGKSTLVHLMQRLYEPNEGSILIGGTPISKIKKSWLRKHVGLILQEPFLYSKTVRENIGIARKNVPQEELAAAARIAQAEGFIQESEKGWDTVVGERGVTLSGGQKQRVAIARTLVKENDILIFDDSLSAVDTQTDAAIREALAGLRNRVTTFIISHRITTLSEADLILVLEKGKIVQEGTHEQLIHEPGLYQRIYAIQTQLESELEEDDAQEVTAHAIP